MTVSVVREIEGVLGDSKRREGLSVLELLELFPDDYHAEAWLCWVRWEGDIRCVDCGSGNFALSAHKKMRFRCRGCGGFFSVKKGTVMESSKLGLQKWVVAIYAAATNLKGISSRKLAREIGVTQKTAWHMMHRIREAFAAGDRELLAGIVEADETYVGGKEANKHEHKRLRAGRGPAGKTAVAGAAQRQGDIVAAPVARTDKETLQGFVRDTVAEGSWVITDESASYRSLSATGLYDHTAVVHSWGEYAVGRAHTNTIESFWAMLKRGIYGTYHHLSSKHLARYVNEFAGRHNIRRQATIDQMKHIVRNTQNKRLRYKDLTAP